MTIIFGVAHYPKIYIQGFNMVVNYARRPNNFNNYFFLGLNNYMT